MTTWILIIILKSGYGLAVDHVPGFASREACEDAKRVVAEADSIFGWMKLYCVPERKP